jgi:thiol-disulfide isomerase/thioredoxin
MAGMTRFTPRTTRQRSGGAIIGLCATVGVFAIGLLALAQIPAHGRQKTAAAWQAAKPAADLAVIDLEGFRKIIADHRGSPLVITIWATWCEPCRDEYPMINQIAQEFASQHVAVVGVSFDQDAELNLVRHFLTRNQPVFPNYRKKMGHQDEFDHGVDPNWPGELPVNFFYAADGKLVVRLDGAQPRQVYETAVRAALAAGGSSHR